MPEYLAPGVYVEEVSFRSKSIEGVPTSTTGYAGMTRFGPVRYPGGPSTNGPRLVTSFTEFESVYGGLEVLHAPTEADERLSYVAHAARSFFLKWRNAALHLAGAQSARSRSELRLWRGHLAHFGERNYRDMDRALARRIRQRVGANPGGAQQERGIPGGDFGGIVQVNGAKQGSIVEVITGGTPPAGNDPLTLANLAQISIDPNDGHQIFNRAGATFLPGNTDIIQNVQLRVIVRTDDQNSKMYDALDAVPGTKRYIGKILQADNPEDENAVIFLKWDPSAAIGNDVGANLMVALQANSNHRLTGGHDGVIASPADLAGQDADPDDVTKTATGLAALGEVDDIAIVALPDGGAYDDVTESQAAADALITHAELLRYRIAVIDPPPSCSMTQIRNFRGQFDSEYSALYHPWIEILDPTERPAQGAPPERLLLPPSGSVTGIYARSDIARGVYKAPANEVVLGLTKFEININKPRQDVLNPEGINALRFFEGRGNRVWGARTMSSDPEWKYVNVRRLFIYLEHSIDKGTQWAVFEPNNERLWANIRSTIEDFLLVQWKQGALMGSKPEEAFFVRCDRTTMTQNDLDNGRLICLIGVAPTYPAEYVIFRIGQWTADSQS